MRWLLLTPALLLPLALPGDAPLPTAPPQDYAPATPPAAAQPAKAVPPQATENDALALAAADIQTVPTLERCWQRYVWIVDGQMSSARAVALAVNYLSRSSTVRRPLLLRRGNVLVSRIDLRHYAPESSDFAAVWEEMQFDPRLSKLITRDTARFSLVDFPRHKRKVTTRTKTGTNKRLVDCEEYVHPDNGQKYRQKWVYDDVYDTTETQIEVDPFEDGTDVVRVVSPHLNPLLVAALVDGTRSQAALVSHPYFISRALTTVQDDGAYKTIYGGLYYRFAGIGRNQKKGTDEDNLFAQIGAADLDLGLTAAQVFDRLPSDARVAVEKSDVTGRPRRVDIFRSRAAHVITSTSIISVTHDLKRKSIDIGTHPLMNLLAFQDDAREVIFERANGLSGFAALDGKGALKDQVPDDVAADTTIPDPYGAVLQPAISCIRCHAKEGGWRILRNDVNGRPDHFLDIFDDVSFRRLGYHSRQEAVERLFGLYSGDPEQKTMPRARDDYAAAILRATGPWKGSKDQTDLVRLSADAIGSIYAQHHYRLFFAADVLRDLGEPEVKDAKARLKELLPPVALAARPGFVPEDWRIGHLLSGKGLVRTDYDLVFSDIATRSILSTRRKNP